MNGITAFISRGAEIAFSRGMIVVASAGNEGGTLILILSQRLLAIHPETKAFQFNLLSYDGRIKPDVMAQGVSAVLSNQFGNIVTNGTLFWSSCGSMVASLAGIPTKTNKEIRALIIQSCR
jgi:hypothetical protein